MGIADDHEFLMLRWEEVREAQNKAHRHWWDTGECKGWGAFMPKTKPAEKQASVILEEKIDNCVYQIERHRCQAKAYENDARNAERNGDFDAAKALSHAAVLEWRRVEIFQGELLDLTRE